MIRTAKHFLRLAVVACVTLTGTMPPAGHSSPSSSSGDIDQICREVQFRRLHLVRPDLIRYPLVLEVYC